jgi:ornithine carbamoyltransferase
MTSSSLHHRHLWAPDRLSAAERRALLTTAAAVKRTKAHQPDWRPLLGRRVALLGGGDTAATALFERAVADLGGSVSLLDGHAWHERAGGRVDEAARLLGRLYDAVDCCGLPAPLLAQIDGQAGVPVFDGLGRADHPLTRLAEQLTEQELHGGDGLAAEAETADGDRRALNRLRTLQAAIVCALP